MKKIVSLLLALALCLCSFAALAEDESMLEMNWEDVLAQLEADPEGEFVALEDLGVQMFIPAGFEALELTEEDEYIAYFMTEDESTAIALQCADADGMTLEEYAEVLSSYEDVSDISLAIVNGLPCLAYTITEEDAAINCIAFTTENGYILEISYGYVTEENELTGTVVLLSVSPIEE